MVQLLKLAVGFLGSHEAGLLRSESNCVSTRRLLNFACIVYDRPQLCCAPPFLNATERAGLGWAAQRGRLRFHARAEVQWSASRSPWQSPTPEKDSRDAQRAVASKPTGRLILCLASPTRIYRLLDGLQIQNGNRKGGHDGYRLAVGDGA